MIKSFTKINTCTNQVQWTFDLRISLNYPPIPRWLAEKSNTKIRYSSHPIAQTDVDFRRYRPAHPRHIQITPESSVVRSLGQLSQTVFNFAKDLFNGLPHQAWIISTKHLETPYMIFFAIFVTLCTYSTCQFNSRSCWIRCIKSIDYDAPFFSPLCVILVFCRIYGFEVVWWTETRQGDYHSCSSTSWYGACSWS